MRNFLALLAVVALMHPVPAAAQMKEDERQRLLAHLDMTESWLLSELQGLTEAQLKFRTGPDSWSIADVVEHLAVAEPQYWTRLQDSVKRPATDRKLDATDAGILWYGIDRTKRSRTGEARVPTGRWKDVRGSLGEFRKLRETMRAYAKQTQDDLRSRALIDGNMDVYQWFLMISAHSQRHILQVREIKAHAAFQ